MEVNINEVAKITKVTKKLITLLVFTGVVVSGTAHFITKAYLVADHTKLLETVEIYFCLSFFCTRDKV